MNENTCRCGTPTRDLSYVCDGCASSLTQALAEVPWLADELETTICRQKAATYNGNTSRGAETPSPLNWGAADARRELHGLLVSWVLFAHEVGVVNSSPQGGLPDDTLAAMSRWLLWRVDGFTLLDIGPEIVAEITAATGKCRRVIDRPADRMYAGRCGNTDSETECETDLYAILGHKSIKCPGCSTVWDVTERRAWLLAEAEEVLATAVEISRAVSWLGAEPLTADRVRQWAARDRLTTRGHDRKGRPMYRVGDAIDLLASTAGKTVA